MLNKDKTNRQAIWFASFVFYAVLLIASHVYQSSVQSYVDAAHANLIEHAVLHQINDNGTLSKDKIVRTYFGQWSADSQTDEPAALLLHGSPGNNAAFGELGELLARGERRIIAPDLPGYGKSNLAPNLSAVSQANYMIQLLDEQGIDQVHVVGWSSSGGIGIEMASRYPQRVASLTLLAAIGAQETEGTGSYSFEHLKYAVGYVGLGLIPEAVPHFGVLGSWKDRSGWLQAFWDSDQRELTKIMPTITTPTMILHGRHDPLVPAWGAEQHHEMMPTSKLVMLDASHFLPFQQAGTTAGYLNDFFARHDTPGVAPITTYTNLAPVQVRHGTDAAFHRASDWVRTIPWWLMLIAVAVFVRKLTTVGLAITMLFVATMSVDFGVAILGMMLGRAWWLMRGAHPIDRPFTLWGWCRGVAYVIPVFVVGSITGSLTIWLTHAIGLLGIILGFSLMLMVLSGMRFIVTWEGRQRLKGEYNRITCHEYWLTGLVYLPMLWWGVKRIATGKGLVALTSVNPGYAHDGGILCESKMDINQKLGDGSVDDQALLHCVLIEPNDNTRARVVVAMAAIANDTQLGGYPVFCKPDQGERGRAVKMIKSDAALSKYIFANDEPFVIQRRHSGKMEVGVLWVRHLESITDPNHQGPSGFIYAITIKHFPRVVGDGKRSIRRLILGHERYRAQSRMFFDWMGDQLGVVPELGQEISLGDAGNHSQGAMFTDGIHLITPELSTRITQIVDRFADDQDRGFDIGRFDLRCESLEQLADGEGFGIVELNGLTSEPSNLYDPKRSIFWAWDMLCGYWIHAEHIAKARIDTNTGEPVDKETWKMLKRALVRVMLT